MLYSDVDAQSDKLSTEFAVVKIKPAFRTKFEQEESVLICGDVYSNGWLGSQVLDSGAEGPGFQLQPRRYRVTVLGKLFTPIVPLLTKQRNWSQPS